MKVRIVLLMKKTILLCFSASVLLCEPSDALEYSRAIFDCSGRYVASDVGGVTRIWETNSGREIRRFRDDDTDPPSLHFVGQVVDTAGFPCAFSPDGRLIATHDYPTSIWNTTTGKKIHKIWTPNGSAGSIQFCPRGNTIAVSDGKFIVVWSLSAKKKICTITTSQDINMLRFSSISDSFITAPEKGPLTEWDVRTGKALRSFGPTSFSGDFEISPNGRILALCGFAKEIVLLDFYSGMEIRKETSDKNHEFMCFKHLAFSPDGSKIAVSVFADSKRNAAILDVQTMRVLKEFHLGSKELKSIAFSPSGNELLTRDDDGTISLWDANSGFLLQNFIASKIDYKSMNSKNPWQSNPVRRSSRMKTSRVSRPPRKSESSSIQPPKPIRIKN